jgi:hypothetical protein
MRRPLRRHQLHGALARSGGCGYGEAWIAPHDVDLMAA